MDDIKIVIQPQEISKIVVSAVAMPSVTDERIFSFTNQLSVSAEHFLGKLVDVAIWDNVGMEVMAQIQQVTLNQVVVSFNEPMSGKIIIK